MEELKLTKALIVDDETEIGLLLGHALKKEKVENNYASSLGMAKEYLQTNKYDLVFLDINLTDGNGLDFIPDLKEHNSEVKIFVISAYNVKEDIEKAYKLGADNFIAKPFNSALISNLLFQNQI